mmetsp:Transcript_26717/g.89878  ORF Transcript_26717/g.89878 Transcript_26717/m.89878 type:complete len:206 (+) Transcript_26717:689-1306(+)
MVAVDVRSHVLLRRLRLRRRSKRRRYQGRVQTRAAAPRGGPRAARAAIRVRSRRAGGLRGGVDKSAADVLPPARLLPPHAQRRIARAVGGERRRGARSRFDGLSRQAAPGRRRDGHRTLPLGPGDVCAARAAAAVGDARGLLAPARDVRFEAKEYAGKLLCGTTTVRRRDAFRPARRRRRRRRDGGDGAVKIYHGGSHAALRRGR